MNIPLSLYIHFPWCIQKCPYCDFNSHAVKEGIPEKAYIDCLLQNLEQQLPYVQGRQLISIFMGGGTPSLISAKGIHDLLSVVEQKIPFAKNIEITLEANPGASEAERFKDYRASGINRISLGIQSFQASFLKILGRVHDEVEAMRAIEMVQTAGFDNFNLDLMHSLPGQTVAQGLADLETAISFNPPHLSWYELTIEPNTLFWAKPPTLPHEAKVIALQEQGRQLLSQHGYVQYEISAYSKHRPCQHNLNYWQFGDYLAIGAGSHGKITTTHEIIRFQHFKHPKLYMDVGKGFVEQRKVIPTHELPFEFMLNVLRLKEGIDTAEYSHRTGLKLHSIEKTMSQAIEKGLLEPLSNHRIAATPLGYRFLNDIMETFLEHAD